MAFRIGEVVPVERGRGIVAGPLMQPVWYALLVPPGRERAVRAYFRANDIFAFYPSEPSIRHNRGRRIEVERPIVARYVYAQFRQAPQWDILQRHRRLITGVICIGGVPVAIPPGIIRHLQGLTVEAQRLAEARAELLRLRPGDRATITAGPLKGFAVEIADIKGGEAWFRFLTGGKGRADIATLERIVPPDIAP